MKNNMWTCLKLDTFCIEVCFSQSKKTIISLLKEKNISIYTPTEMQIVIKSKLLSLDFEFSISFHFNGEKIISITLSPYTALESRALYSRYSDIQKALEIELGPPHYRSSLVMDLLSPDNRFARWQKNEIKIEHYLLNRFGLEETINIEL